MRGCPPKVSVPCGRSLSLIDILVGLLTAVLIVLMFAGGPGHYADRVTKHVWNLGHVFAFFLWTWYLAKRWTWLIRLRPLYRILLLAGGVFGAGLLIEGLQYGTARSADWQDIGRNMLGCLVAICWTHPLCRDLKPSARGIGRLASILLGVLALAPLSGSLADTYLARRDFPVLADFETPLELERWSGDAHRERTTTVRLSGQYALKVMLGTTRYSGVSLNSFPRDWQVYRALEIGIFNPDQDVIFMTCRIHDRRHIEGPQRYQDRFNRRYAIQQGWNRIRIPLQDVQAAPEGRSMDLRDVMAVGLFATGLDHPRVVFLDHIRLS
jgi:hypothetical protein